MKERPGRFISVRLPEMNKLNAASKDSGLLPIDWWFQKSRRGFTDVL
jgi:hypothetical protein